MRQYLAHYRDTSKWLAALSSGALVFGLGQIAEPGGRLLSSLIVIAAGVLLVSAWSAIRCHGWVLAMARHEEELSG